MTRKDWQVEAWLHLEKIVQVQWLYVIISCLHLGVTTEALMNDQYLQEFGQCHNLLLQRCAGPKARQNGCLCQTFQSFKTCFNSLHSHQVALHKRPYCFKSFAFFVRLEKMILCLL